MAVTFEKRIATNRLGEYAKLRDSEAWFTIHENGNTGSSPFDEAGFVKGGGGSGKVMYHFAVGVEGGQPTIVQIFPVNKRGKHAGNAEGNATSVAVETCQAPPGATSAPTQEALRELMYMLYTGDKRIEGIEGYTFSPDRTRGHKDWPGANPACPATMKAKWGGVEPVVKAVRERLAGGTPGPTYAKPLMIKQLDAFRDRDDSAIPILVPATTGVFFFIGRDVTVTKTTPRNQTHLPESKKVGPDLVPGEKFYAWFGNWTEDGKRPYTYTKWGTIIFLDDTDMGVPQ